MEKLQFWKLMTRVQGQAKFNKVQILHFLSAHPLLQTFDQITLQRFVRSETDGKGQKRIYN